MEPRSDSALDQLRGLIDEGAARHGGEFVTLSHDIHAEPELAFSETASARKIVRLLERHAFTVRTGVGGLATAFDATIGSGPLHIAVLAEYDALPDIGHACGHNIIAAAAAGAGVLLADIVDRLDATVHVIGTPAEESGGGKEVLLRGGVFDDIAAAVMMHPGESDVVDPPSLAVAEFRVGFHGRAAHAAAGPETGINAGDAVTVSQVAIGLLRQQLPAGQLIHGIVTDGGSAPNIIPERAGLHYLLRAPSAASLSELSHRLIACFEAGGIATGCRVDVEEIPPRYLELRADPLLAAACASAFARLGRRDNPTTRPMGSTDMGNLMATIPGVHPMVAVGDGTVALHQREFADACAGPSGDDAVLDGARLLADIVATIARTPRSRGELLEGVIRRRAEPTDPALVG